MCHFCTINAAAVAAASTTVNALACQAAAESKQGNTHPEAVSAQGRASQEAGSAQGREDRGKTHTEGRPILFGIQPQVYHHNPHGDPIPAEREGKGGAE